MAAPPAVSAAACNQAHQITLSGGAATPGSGTTATSFTFSVTYQDDRGCAPSIASVQIGGVGSFGLTGAGTKYRSGVTFSGTMTLPAGSHAYTFAFMSGTGAGVTSSTLTTVSPASVVVAAPAPPPPPPPTPAPQPPAPPAATPVPVTPATSLSPEASPSATPLAETPAQDRVAGWEGTISWLHPGGPGDGTAPGGGGFGLRDIGLARLAAWVGTTAGGAGLFLLLMRQGRRAENGSLPQQLALPEAPAWRSPTHAVAPDVPPNEANLPRWLRPSVQAARGRRRS